MQAGAVHGGIHLHSREPATPVPRQLLPVTGNFTGRQHDLEVLDQLHRRRDETTPQLIVITGPAGVGKTTFTSRWLRKVAEDFPDGCLYADLRGHDLEGPAAPGEVLGAFLRALNVGPVPVSLAEQTALWRSATADLRIAVMLDNALSAAQVRPLLPGCDASLAMVTSRQRLSGLRADGAHFHTLGLLGPDAAVELLSRGVGRARIESEASAARQVAALCAGLPLAVCLASARLASRPRQSVEAMADALAQEQERLAVLRVEGETVVRSALDESCSVLPADAVGLYRRLGLLSVPTVNGRVAAAAGAIPLPVAEELLDVLVEANLIEDIGPDAYRFHDLVRLHAREEGRAHETEAACDDTQRRVCDWYLYTATQAEALLTPHQLHLPRNYRFSSDLPDSFSDEAEALTWLDAQRFNLVSVIHAAVDHGWHDTAWQSVDAMWPLFLRLRYYDLWFTAHETGLAAARRAGHKAAERQMLNSGAIGLSAAGKTDAAIQWYDLSLEAAREAEDPRDEGQALLGLGAAYREAGRLSEAGAALDEAISIWERVGYVRGVALARVVLGEMALGSEKTEKAVEYFSSAHDLFTTVDDPHDEARALAFLGHARAQAGDHESGVAELGRALGVFERAGSAHWQARTLEMMGGSAQSQGDFVSARAHYERALGLFGPISPEDAQRLRGRLERCAPADRS